MNQTSPISALQQSKNLGFWRFCALASRIILWLIVLCWALFALAWVVLHGIIVPRIDELRPQLEIQATKALGVPVRIDGANARWQLPHSSLTTGSATGG